jgi:hypothetical protein
MNRPLKVQNAFSEAEREVYGTPEKKKAQEKKDAARREKLWDEWARTDPKTWSSKFPGIAGKELIKELTARRKRMGLK